MAFTVSPRISFTTNPFDAIPVYVELDSYCMGLSIRRGRQHELDRIEAGSAIITLLNTSGNFWPNNAGGAYYPNVLPGKGATIIVTYSATPYNLFTGFIESWQPDFILRPIKGAIMRVTATDLSSIMATYQLNNAGYAQELSGTRIGNVLDSISWPAGMRTIAAGMSNMKASGALANQNTMGHLFDVQESERGLLFLGGNGKVVYQDRSIRLLSPYNVAQATFGDTSPELGYHAIEFAYDTEYIYNDIRITRSGGTEQVASDATSQTKYGPRSLVQTGLLLTTDAEALSLAQHLLAKYKDPVIRAKSITIRPGVDEANLMPKVLNYDISTRIKIRLAQASIDEDYYIEGIAHDWDADTGIWETRWEVMPVSNQVYWALGVAGSSEMGQTTRVYF